MNPSAFQFVPGQVRGNAPPFQPGQQPQNGQQAPQGQQQPFNPYAQYQQGGFHPYAQYNNGGYYGQQPQQFAQQPQQFAPYGQPYGAPPPQQAYQRSQQQPPQSWDEPEPAPAQAPPVREKITLPPPTGPPKTISLSIGGGAKSSSSTPKDTPPQTPKPPQTEAKAAPSPAKADAPPAAAPVKPAAEPVAKPAESASKPAAAAPAAASTSKAVDADVVLKQQEAVDEEALQELYGAAEEGKAHCNIVFIGHVDAGKSTMGGNILFITGMVDKRTMEKYEREAKEAGRESWYLSWALDSTIQERDKGKTVEVGRAYFETDKRRYTILDAPGHKTYVPSMISGAAQADVAVLVISARKGEFETGFERGGQTREHAMLVKTAGIQKLIVAVNKMDDPTVQWDQARFEEIKSKLVPFLKGTGFNPKTDITIIPLSGYTGANLKERHNPGWYSGPSLLEHLDEMTLNDRKTNAPLLMPISEKYKDMGTILVGKIEAGRLRKGSDLMLMPNKTPVEVLAIYSELEEEISAAVAGDNIRIRVRGVDDEDVSVGFVLSDAKTPVHTVTQFEAQLVILDHKNIICSGYSAVLHVHTLAEEVTLGALLHYYDKKTGRKSKRPPQFAKKGMKIIARVEVAAPICIERFEDAASLGRFTLRDEGKTIAIGKVTKLLASKIDEEAAAAVASLSVNGTA